MSEFGLGGFDDPSQYPTQPIPRVPDPGQEYVQSGAADRSRQAKSYDVRKAVNAGLLTGLAVAVAIGASWVGWKVVEASHGGHHSTAGPDPEFVPPVQPVSSAPSTEQATPSESHTPTVAHTTAAPRPTPSRTPTPSSTPSPTKKPTPTATPEPTPTPTPSASPSSNRIVPPVPTSEEEFKIAQTMIVGFPANTPLATIKKVVADTHIGGYYLTGTTDASRQGFTPQFDAELSKAAGAPMIVASDEEGGQIDRYKIPALSYSAKQMGTMSVSRVEQIGQEGGRQMRADGVTMDLAPVLDLDDGGSDGAITRWDRSFGGSPANIASKAGAFAQGLELSGVVPVLKHFPGIGLAKPDSDTDDHKAVSPPLAELEANDLVPYEKLLPAAGAVMMSNEYVTGLDPNNPASISSKVVAFLRQKMHFDGVVMTDDLSVLKKYDGKSEVQNVVAAVQAGVDAPLFGFTNEAALKQAIEEIATHVPAVQIDASYAKILALKQRS